MERDFLGLKWKESSSQTPNEITKTNTIFNDSVSGMQRSSWSENSFSRSSELLQPPPVPVKATTQGTPTSPVYANFDYNYYYHYNHSTKPLSTDLPKKSFNRPLEFPFQDETIPTSNHQFLGGFPFAACSSTSSSINSRNKSKQILLDLEAPYTDKLTIIFDDKIHVFDDISPHKAEAIMRLAEEEYSKSCFRADEEKITLTQEPADQSPPSILTSMPIANNLPATTTLPLTRKATLEHFMEKRKDRMKNPGEVLQFHEHLEALN